MSRATQDPTGPREGVAYRAVTVYGRPSQGRVPGCHRLWPAFPGRSASLHEVPSSWSYNPGGASTPPVWAPPLSLAATRGIMVIFFSCGYLDVSVPRVRLPFGMAGLPPAGLPHSDIPGSGDICSSPGLFAAYHVLRRLREPRHPPSALAHFRSPGALKKGARGRYVLARFLAS